MDKFDLMILPPPKHFDGSVNKAVSFLLDHSPEVFNDSMEIFLNWMIFTLGELMGKNWGINDMTGEFYEFMKNEYGLDYPDDIIKFILIASYKKHHGIPLNSDIEVMKLKKARDIINENLRIIMEAKEATKTEAAPFAPPTIEAAVQLINETINSISPELRNNFEIIFINKAIEAFGDYFVENFALANECIPLVEEIDQFTDAELKPVERLVILLAISFDPQLDFDSKNFDELILKYNKG